MSNNNLNDDDFKLVSHKKSRLKIRNINLETQIEPVTSSNRFDSEYEIRRIETTKQELLTTTLYSSILASLREGLGILHTPKIGEIVCFGLGKIAECVVARYQFALLLCLRDVYKVKTFVYDPIFSEIDRSILSAFNCDLLPENIEGKYLLKEKHVTLFYLPHCPKQLTNNLLWSNWGLQLHHCVIVANSFTKILESNSKRDIMENAEYILKASPYVTELAIINSFKYYDIFNDTAIHIFPWNNLSLVSQDFWEYCVEPKYSENDVEFIRIKLGNKVKL